MKSRKERIFIIVFAFLITVLALAPTGFARAIYFNSEGAKAKVIKVDNSGVYMNGIISQGDQRCIVEILSGPHKGETAEAINMLAGKMDIDKSFVPGDIAWTIVEQNQDNTIRFVNMVDYYRIDKELVLVGLFALLIILFSGFTGIRTILSFTFTLLAVWKILIPLTLSGYPPLPVALFVGCLITVVTLFMVGGVTKKALAAIGGALTCSLITCILAVIFTGYFRVHGAVLPWSESLLYSGYQSLNLTEIYMAAVYLACSGAILDLAIDISAALDEIVVYNPDLSRAQLVKSGLTIGKSVVGSQTSTLLLAYMGSYLTIMMVYMAQATPWMSILNSKTIAAEILQTFVGCIGLVLVSPCTSLISAFLYSKKTRSF